MWWFSKKPASKPAPDPFQAINDQVRAMELAWPIGTRFTYLGRPAVVTKFTQEFHLYFYGCPSINGKGGLHFDYVDRNGVIHNMFSHALEFVAFNSAAKRTKYL